MTTFFRFYKPEYNPTGLSGTVGGSISSNELAPRISALFSPVAVSEVAPVTQYRKLFIKQAYDATLTGITIELANVEYPDHISFGTGSPLNETSDSPTNAPSGVTFSATDVELSMSTVIDSTIPVWIKQTIPAGSTADDFVSFQLRILATIV